MRDLHPYPLGEAVQRYFAHLDRNYELKGRFSNLTGGYWTEAQKAEARADDDLLEKEEAALVQLFADYGVSCPRVLTDGGELVVDTGGGYQG